jgi:hypothetical protein
MKRFMLLFIMHPLLIISGMCSSKEPKYEPVKEPINASDNLPLIKIMVALYKNNDKDPSSRAEGIYYADDQGFYRASTNEKSNFKDLNRITIDKVQIDPINAQATVECNLRIGRGRDAKTTHEPAQPAKVFFDRSGVAGCTPAAAALGFYLTIAAKIVTSTE